MKNNTFIRQISEWQCFAIIVLLLIHFNVSAQSVPVYANTISSQDNVDFASNATDSDLATRARIRANSGLLFGVGAYSGHLELQFPSTLPANTTSYVKIQTEDEILPSLLGGSLGNLLSTVLGTLLIGNQEITVEAKNGATSVLDADSQVTDDFATPRIRIVVNAANEYFIALTPNQAYDRIRLTNRLGSLIGLNNTKRFDVYGAYYIGTADVCGGASYTSFDGSGLTLDLLGLGGAGVTNPNNVLDANANNFSRLSLGIIAVAGSVEQTVYFDGASQPTDQFFIRLRIDPTLLAVGVANNIQFVASNGPNIVQAVNLNSLLNLDLLTLLQGNQSAIIRFTPGAPVTRITVRYNSLLNVQLTQSLDLYSVSRAPANPTINDAFTQDAVVCSGSTASLVAETGTGTELNWYSSATGGTALATTNSGQPFVTPVLTTDTSFYVSAKRTGCAEESQRIRIDVDVINLPVAADILIASPVNACNGSIVLSPASSIGGADIKYYKDQAKTIEVTTGYPGDVGVGYVKDNTTGALSITGLNAIDSPYVYYISLTVDGLCENVVGTLKPVVVNFSSALDLIVSSTISGCGSVNLRDAILNFDNSPDIQYNFFDSASQPITAEAASNIQSSGTFFIQAVSLSGSCSSTTEQVIVTVNPIPTLTITDSNVVVNLGSAVILDATSDSAITWYDAEGNALPSNTFGPFAVAGYYTFTAVASNGNCSRTGTVSVIVIDPANCPALTERVYADSQSWSSIITGGVASASSAVDGNPQTHSTIVTGIGLLGIGTTWQTLQWADTIPAGTPVTVKLGSEYSGLVVAGAYSVIGTKRNGSGIPIDIGVIQPVSGSLADLLPGENTFAFTFVPSDFSGPKAYDGIRIIVGSVLSVAQNVKVYDAYYDKQVTQVACGIGDVEDIYSGVVDLGIGVATATVGVDDEWNAVDGNSPTYATMYSGVGVLAAADMTVLFRTPTLTTDRLEMIVSKPATILDLSVLAGFTIQLWMGNTPMTPQIAINSALVNLNLIDGNTRARITLQSQTVLYDRIKIRFGGVAAVLDELRIHEIRRMADTSVIGAINDSVEVCAGQTIQLTVPADDCTTYIWYDAATGGNVVSTGSSFTIPITQAAGTYTYYIQPVRFGCETFERGTIEVSVGQTAPPTAITDVSLNGGTVTTFCDETDITLSATLNSTITITNPVFHWYDTANALIAGETLSTLVLTGLAPGTYTYGVGVSSDEYCETAEADRATVTFTILPFSQPSDITVDDTLVCQGTDAVLEPTSTQPNPQFFWFFSNDNSQPIISGSTVGTATYTIDANGQLTVSGLTSTNSPYTYYVGLTSDETCLNQDGDFEEVTIIVNDLGTPTTNDATQDFCVVDSPTLTDIQVNEPNSIWFDAATNGNQLPDTTPLANGTSYYAGFAPSSGCGSAVRLQVTVNVNDAPTPTTNNATQDFCVINNPTVANIQVNEAGVTWYNAATDGTAFASTDVLVNGAIYYGSLTVAGCESSIRLAVTVNVNDADTPTTNSATQDFCLVNSPTVADIQVNETGVIWYDAATGGNVLAASAALIDNTIYYATIIDGDNGCESSVRLAVTVNVNDPLPPTTSTLTPSYCQSNNPTIADIQINETNVIWYDAATGGNVLPTTTALVNGTTLYAAQFDPLTGCESSVRYAATIIVNDAPTPTTNSATQDFCVANNPTIADIQVNESDVTWYNLPTGGTAYASTDILIDNTIYYGSLTVAGCESSVRLAVTVNVNDAPTPTTNDATQDFCLEDNPTIANIQVNEAGVIWYNAPTNGNALPSTNALTNGTTYYGSLTVAGCESSVRLAVNINVNDPGTPTTNDTNQNFCVIDSPTVADLQVNETNVLWYNAISGGTAYGPTDALTTATYYAVLFDNITGCESAIRLAVAAVINDAPTPTTNDNTQDFCLSANPTVGNIQVNEIGVMWYTAATGGTLLANSDALVNGATYYGTINSEGCDSSVRLAITVTIIDGGTPTTADNAQDFCLADTPTLANIQTNENNIVWFDAANGGDQLPASTSLVNNATYYASFDSSVTCASSIRLSVTVSVHDAATPTTNDATQEFCQTDNATVADIQVNESGVIWYSSATGGTALASNAVLTETTYYAALVDAFGCESAIRLAVTVSFIANATATITGGSPEPCVFDSSTYTTQSGMSNYVWVITNGTIVAGGQTTDNFVTVMWPAIVNAAGVGVSYTNSCNGTSTGFVGVNVITCSDILITKTVSNPNPMIGETVTFTVTVTNAGHGEFHDVAVTDILPSGYSFIGISSTDGTWSGSTWNIPVLSPNEVAVMTMTVTVLSTGDYMNVASIGMSNPLDSDLTNNSAWAAVDPLCLIVYNEFSPNNDGANDLFKIDCIENYPQNKLEVFNRYGSLVYTKSHYVNDWDGTANVSGVINKDDKLPTGTYYYVLDIGADGIVKTGWLAITR